MKYPIRDTDIRHNILVSDKEFAGRDYESNF